MTLHADQATTREVLSLCRSLGFALVGIAPAGPTGQGDALREWLAAGRQGDMDFMTRDLHLRLDPRGHLADCRAFVMVADLYRTRNDTEPEPQAGHGRIARYARGRNYHDVMKKRLHRMADTLRARFPGSDFRSFVDTAPVLERELAALAGLGWQAKNTMLIHPRVGSYLLLGGAATNLPLPAPPEQTPIEDACGTCTRCIDACPTSAIDAKGVDATRCISYLTIEHEREIDPGLHGGMRDWLYGCDVCQEVCPHNSPRPAGSDVGAVLPAYAPRVHSLPILDVMTWTEAARREAFLTTAMKRASLLSMRRNAIIAAVNSLKRGPDAALLARIEAIAADETEPQVLRMTARDGLESLRGR